MLRPRAATTRSPRRRRDRLEIAENKVLVLIVDELQKIGDVRINAHLIYELFNLFIRLTKELHLCHVFAVTLDSLFVGQVCSEAMALRVVQVSHCG